MPVSVRWIDAGHPAHVIIDHIVAGLPNCGAIAGYDFRVMLVGPARPTNF
jgi:hypothetical protein